MVLPSFGGTVESCGQAQGKKFWWLHKRFQFSGKATTNDGIKQALTDI
jgi:hypothetical protein